jgi:hypothetical protein
MNKVRKIPRSVWLDENSYFYHLYKARKKDNPLYLQIARIFHNGLPDEVADCLTDALLNAEVRGELEQFRMERYVPEILDAVTAALRKLAIVVENEHGEECLAVPLDDLPMLKNADAMNRLMR